MMPIDLESELDRLYGLPLEEFIAGRDELAKRLRGEDRRDEAEQVKALRKPPVAVWLVNRLARERELDVRHLLDAGEALGKAQAKGSEEFAAARRDEHYALGRLVEAARELAKREGTGQTAVDRATQTLRAAAVSDEGRELLHRGRLTEELEPPGFEALTGLVPAPPRKASRPRPTKQARERLQRLQRAEKEADSAARAAERDADRAEQEAAKLRERAAEARAKAQAATAAREAAEP